MVLVLDANALIKLHRAGILALVAAAFRCIAPAGVYHEAIVMGMARGYADASEIDAIVKAAIEILPSGGAAPEDPGKDGGEAEALALAQAQTETAIIVSDDSRFLADLDRLGAAYITPVDLLVTLRREGWPTDSAAREALELMRLHIRQSAYQRALNDLKG